MNENKEIALADAQTGEVAPTAQFWNEFDLSKMLGTVGTYELTEAERETLYNPIDPSTIEVRPHDGIVYIPHTEFTQRWSKAFGLGYGLIPQGMPKMQGDLMVWGWYLVIRGHLVGFALGGQRYVANNPMMTFDDAAEGAKSNAITRLGKAMGMFPELWTPSFVRDWKEKYSVKGNDGKWFKRGSLLAKVEAKADEKVVKGALERIAGLVEAYDKEPKPEQILAMKKELVYWLSKALGKDNVGLFFTAIYADSMGVIENMPTKWVGGLLKWLAIVKPRGAEKYGKTHATDQAFVEAQQILAAYLAKYAKDG